jgi:hypothetical protein
MRRIIQDNIFSDNRFHLATKVVWKCAKEYIKILHCKLKGYIRFHRLMIKSHMQYQFNRIFTHLLNSFKIEYKK